MKQIVDQRLHRHARSPEARCASENSGINLNLSHVRQLYPQSRCFNSTGIHREISAISLHFIKTRYHMHSRAGLRDVKQDVGNAHGGALWPLAGSFDSLFPPSPQLHCIALLDSPLRTQATDDIENAKFQATGAVNSNSVYIRSGPSENDYATMKLDKGAQVTVVGERFNWLKILPPEGSFCYLSKAYVNRAGNGSIGMVTGHVYIRVGSALNTLKTKTATTLEPNQRVEIIGEQDEYFKVKPTDEVYVYVNKQFVDFVGLNDPSKKGAVPALGASPASPTVSQDDKSAALQHARPAILITRTPEAPADAADHPTSKLPSPPPASSRPVSPASPMPARNSTSSNRPTPTFPSGR